MTTTPHAIDPTLATLASAMRVQYATDGAAVRAIDRAVEHMSTALPYEFDGVELRIVSYSRRKDGTLQISDGVSCTCESAGRTWCWHRVAQRLMVALWALTEPMQLRSAIMTQLTVEDTYDDQGGFLDAGQPAAPPTAPPLPARTMPHYDDSQWTVEDLF